MILASTPYDQVKIRAIEILQAADGINGHTPDEVKNLTGRPLAITVGVALCMARDEQAGILGFGLARFAVPWPISCAIGTAVRTACHRPEQAVSASSTVLAAEVSIWANDRITTEPVAGRGRGDLVVNCGDLVVN